MSLSPIPVSQVLQSVLDDFRERTEFENQEELYTFVAEKLSAIAKKEPAWSAKYIYNVLKIENFASKKFEEAVNILAVAIDGVPIVVAQARKVTILTSKNIKENTLIEIDSRPCASPDCTVWFIPNVHNRIHCYICRPLKDNNIE